jgi:uncharacterized protein (TIGR01777 family)
MEATSHSVKQKRVFVTGATGLVGRSLCLRLRRDGYHVLAWVRNKERAREVLGAEIELVSEQDGPNAFENAVASSTHAVNLAGASVSCRWSKKHKQAIVSSRLDLTRRLVNAMGVSPRAGRVLVSASAVGYYGDRADEALDENAAAGAGFLAELCAEWEAEAMSAPDARVVCLRIGVVLSATGGALSKMLPPFRAGLGGRIGSGRQYMPWIHLDDLLEIIMRGLQDEKLVGPVNAVSPTPVDNRDFTKVLGRVLGRPTLLPVPGPMLKMALGQMAQIALQSQRAVPTKLQSLGHTFAFETLEPALRDLLQPDDGVDFGTAEGQTPTRPSDYLQKRKPRYLLQQRVAIDAPIEDVFAFFSRAENLGAVTPPDLSFSIRTPVPIEMSEGTNIDYRIRLGPVPMGWQTVIEHWQPDSEAAAGKKRACFVDAQHRGPYRCWWHEHHFEAAGQRTLMHDRVFYAPPLGLLGAIANRLFVRPMLRLIFGYRSRAIRLRFGRADAAGRELAA